MSNYEDELPELTIPQMCMSEEIQYRLMPTVMEFIDEKASLIDALDLILAVLHNDSEHELEVYKTSWAGTYD